MKRVYFIGICRNAQAYEWFHDIVERIEIEDESGAFNFRFYLTEHLKIREIANIFSLEEDIDRDDIVRCRHDPITLLNSPTFYGRPNWEAIFRMVVNDCFEERVGVFYCGPSALGHIIEGHCKRHQFDFYREKFE